MPTFLGHSLVALTVASPLRRTSLARALPISWWLLLTVLLSLVPDLDILLLHWLPYSHPLSHRGLSHSIFFALLFTLVITMFCRLAGILQGDIFTLLLVWLVLAAVMASHGLLDAFTDGGLGIALFSPFTPHRYFFPVRPLPVAWLSPAAMFSPYMLHVYAVEAALFGPFCLATASLSGLPRFSPLRRPAAALLLGLGIAAWAARSFSI